MGRLVEGRWTTEWYEPDEQGRFVRGETQFRGRVENGPTARHPVAAGRYHLYVSLACPWAHRTLIMRALKGLEHAIDVSVVHPHMDRDGWAFGACDGCTSDGVLHKHFLREIYLHARKDYTGRVTVPVLWDKVEETIVSNESRELLRMLDVEFDTLATRKVDYCPAPLRQQVDATITAIYEPINNGVYRCGFATTQHAYEEAVGELFAALDRYERVLSERRYLCGNVLTEADICLFTTLFRFDAVYYSHFKTNLRRIVDYPNLWGFVRDVYQVPHVRETCNLEHIKTHYFTSHPTINPNGLVPVGPRLNFDEAHGRERLG